MKIFEDYKLVASSSNPGFQIRPHQKSISNRSITTPITDDPSTYSPSSNFELKDLNYTNDGQSQKYEKDN